MKMAKNIRQVVSPMAKMVPMTRLAVPDFFFLCA